MTNGWIIVGFLAFACLLIVLVGVLLEKAYDAGFEDGFAKGQEVTR